MPRRLHRRLLLFPAVVCLLAQAGAVPEPRLGGETLDAAFRDMSRFLFSDADDALSAAERAAGKPPPDLRLARAVALLNRQPRTRYNVEQARSRLLDLVDEPGLDRPSRALVCYLLAQVSLWHLGERDTAAARTWYRRAASDYFETEAGQYAMAKLATLEIFCPELGGTRREALARVETWEAPKFPAARRAFFMVLGLGHQLFTGDHERVLAHYLEAERAGYLKDNLDINIRLRIAIAAIETGRLELAREHLRRALELHPRNNRAETARRLLAALEEGEFR